ncbi:hypothetical protein AB0E27_28050 [Streptomyces sparsogenes]|uniref:hypothetical protein n=1 Tax=Streptomyces sparsogenes TaxID=67365 RepID=UPI00340BCDC3
MAEATHTLAELLTRRLPEDSTWTPPDLTGLTAVVQPHCHQHAVLGFDADRELLAKAGASITELAGCCGLAGNLGMEKGHYEVSFAVAENALLPALRQAHSCSNRRPPAGPPPECPSRSVRNWKRRCRRCGTTSTT